MTAISWRLAPSAASTLVLPLDLTYQRLLLAQSGRWKFQDQQIAHLQFLARRFASNTAGD